MMFKTAAILSIASAALASPQLYGPPSPPDTAAPAATSASSTVTSTSGQILVQVGANGGFAFTPANFTAAAGTLVTFVFGANIPHSVTQSSGSDAPCTPATGGFSSGLTQGTTFSVNITDASTPIYFFCEFPAHCGTGMVGSINAPTSGNGTFDNLMTAALAIGVNEPTVSNTDFVSGGLAALATAAPTTGTPTVSGAAASTTAGGTSSGSSGSTTSGASSMSASIAAVLLGTVAAFFGSTL
ncbi:hypothetical protein BDY19DRAFT_910166 [Irpex rosettiformis]|uniref:Uncharacterized protein n=1 Tax=Irpex rosettiformis TaxID=378272 RepID=A0ACB8TPM9_9APHY|nr:hypothetical protein BDY19DRAFT_910166 [Irpex rosettiformis]